MDTINIRLSREQAGKVDLMASVPALLKNVKYGEDEAGKNWFIGRVDSFKVVVNDNAVSVKDGSLTKYYFGNNLKIMGRSDIEKAIQKLSDELHLPFARADVKALHFGKNISVKYPVSLYLPYLGNNGRYIRLEQKTALNYKITGRELCIYDKKAEMKHRGDFLQELYKNCQVLRYEKRYLQNISKYFNCQSLKVANLYDESFYINLVKDWYNDYLKIQKQKTVLIDMEMITTKEQMKMLGVLSLVERMGGKFAAIQNISERYKTGKLTKKQAHDLKELVRQSTGLKMQTKNSDFVIELDSKMKQAVKYFR